MIQAELHDAGTSLVPDALEGAAVRRLIAACDRAGATTAAHQRKGRVYALRGLLRRAPEVAEAAASGPALRLAQAALGSGARPVKATFFDKIPGANWKVPWHQDLTVAVKTRRAAAGFGPWTEKDGVLHAEAPQTVLESMVALRIHLDDCGPENGALMVIPGSHRMGKLDPQARAATAAGANAMTCCASAGDVLLMRPLLLHRSSPAADPRHRRVLHIEYAATELPGGLEWAN